MKRNGFAPIIIILIAVLVLGAAGGGYYLISQGKIKNPVQSVTEKVVETAMQIDPKIFDAVKDPLVKKHFIAQLKQTAYRIETQTANVKTANINDVVINGKEFRFHMTQMEDGKDTSQMITMGDTTYVKDYKDNQWWKQTQKPEASDAPLGIKIDPEEMIKEYTEKKVTIEYKSLGEEACGQLTCHKYQEVDPENSTMSNRIFWFDNKDFLLRKEEYKFGETISTNIYTYQDIKVDAPTPTKDVPEGKNIYEMMISAELPEDVNAPAASSMPKISKEDMQKIQDQIKEMGLDPKSLPIELDSE